MTACLLLFRTSSRWRSINISVAEGGGSQIRNKSQANTSYYIQLSLTHNIRKLGGKWVAVLQEKKK